MQGSRDRLAISALRVGPSIGVGSKAFVEKTRAELGIKAIGREVVGADGVYELRDRDVYYSPNFADENSGLRLENSYFGNVSI